MNEILFSTAKCTFDFVKQFLEAADGAKIASVEMILENMELIQRVHLNKSCAVVALGSTRNARSGEVQCGVALAP